MTLQQLIYFREVANVRNFTRSAEHLFMSQSSLSHSIRILEDELKVPLFMREPGKGVELTEYGEILLRSADKVLAEIETAREEIENSKTLSDKPLRIAYSYINGYHLISRLLRAFRESPQSKNIRIHVDVNHSDRFFERNMKEEKTDIAFSAGESFHGLFSVPVAQQKLFVLLPARHPLASLPEITLDLLENEALLIYLEGRHLHAWIQKMYALSGKTLQVHEFYNNWSSMLEDLSMGEGAAICPQLPIDEDLVKAVPLNHPMSRRNIYMHCCETAQLSRPARIFRDFCLQYFQS